MPEVKWTDQDRKEFWRSLRAGLWTLIVVLAILLLFKVVEAPEGLRPWIFLVYFIALWVPVYKAIRARWGR